MTDEYEVRAAAVRAEMSDPTITADEMRAADILEEYEAEARRTGHAITAIPYLEACPANEREGLSLAISGTNWLLRHYVWRPSVARLKNLEAVGRLKSVQKSVILKAYDLREVMRDGVMVHKMRCPGCGTWADLDDDQWHGRVSILCDCGFHETLDLAELMAAVEVVR